MVGPGALCLTPGSGVGEPPAAQAPVTSQYPPPEPFIRRRRSIGTPAPARHVTHDVGFGDQTLGPVVVPHWYRSSGTGPAVQPMSGLPSSRRIVTRSAICGA